MDNRLRLRRGTSTFGRSAQSIEAPALEAARRSLALSGEAALATLQAAIRPEEAFRKQLEASDQSRSFGATFDQYNRDEARINALRATEVSAQEQVRRQVETMDSVARFAALESTVLAIRAIQDTLWPSRTAAKYLEELTSNRC